MALSHAWVSAMVSSSRSTRLKPSWPPSVVATRLATGMNSDDAGILSSARFRFATCASSLFLAVRRLLHLARGGRFQLLTLSLRGRDPVLDRFAHRVLRVADHLPRTLGGILRALHRLASAELDGLAAKAVDLCPAWARRDVSACREAD